MSYGESFQKEYQEKLVSAEKAVSCIKDGDWIDYGYNIGTPDALDKALAKRIPELYDLHFRSGNTLKKPVIFDVPEAAKHFEWNTIHTSGFERKYMDMGLVYYVPIRYSELPKYYRENYLHTDVLMFQVAPMDQHGYFNFGPNASHLMAACEIADKIIVEVNQNMPRCLGGQEVGVHISMVDMIVEGENPELTTIASGSPDEEDQTIAGYLLDEISNGCCLQLGIGNTPNALGRMLLDTDLKDLGVHSEMYCDAFMELTLAGKINSAKKNIDKGRQTYTFAAGSKELYSFINENPALLSAPVDYTNDIARISSIDNFISINSCINFDLFGQVNAETAGLRHISGAGGQMDFVIGSYLSRGGKSFICTKSTYKDKDGNLQSTILPTLAEGTVITSTRSNVQYLVTEFGKVNLKGLSTWQRAEAIISIAHPDFRDQLIQSAEKMHIWRRSNR